MLLVKKILLTLVFLLIVGLVIYYVEPPKSWQEASVPQILLLFIPLLAFLTFLLNIIFSYLPQSFMGGVGLMFLIVLQGMRLLNPLVGIIIIIFTAALIYTSPKYHYKISLPFIKHDPLNKMHKISLGNSKKQTLKK